MEDPKKIKEKRNNNFKGYNKGVVHTNTTASTISIKRKGVTVSLKPMTEMNQETMRNYPTMTTREKCISYGINLPTICHCSTSQWAKKAVTITS